MGTRCRRGKLLGERICEWDEERLGIVWTRPMTSIERSLGNYGSGPLRLYNFSSTSLVVVQWVKIIQ